MSQRKILRYYSISQHSNAKKFEFCGKDCKVTYKHLCKNEKLVTKKLKIEREWKQKTNDIQPVSILNEKNTFWPRTNEARESNVFQNPFQSTCLHESQKKHNPLVSL